VVQGNTFQLFSTGGSGNFTNITPALTGGLSWSFNPANGVLSVASPLAQPSLNFSKTGNSIQFSWSVSGFKLQVQTNSLNVGISTNWVDYLTGGVSPVTVPIDPSQGTVFFRLISTP
jgi:hypothetical protein